ncbi:MAG: allophanate hydrolase subunit 1 [Actinomycetales bacterium]|nr:allophanate hydrolase subunit 1 [Actinomycetales bacterium]
MRIQAYGERALLVDLPDLDAVHVLADLLAATGDPRILDVVPAAETLLVVVAEPGDLAGVAEVVAGLDTSTSTKHHELAEPVPIPVRYDGADLDAVAEATGLTRTGVVERHAGPVYSVDFMGFLPGFAYLSGLDPVLHLPRLETPRTRVPAGSVAIAGERCAVYPRESPGGWRLLGHTDVVMFDLAADPPALLRAGLRVRFEPIGAPR